jgi:uracil-DNA glycosylase
VRALDVLALDRLRGELAACRRCDVAAEVRPVVSPARAPRAMLVGQAPGKSEISDGRAFTGRAGRTLFRWLARGGIEEGWFREHVYIAAVTRCYPGPHPSGRGDRVPSPAERARCGDWLARELAIIRPALVLPVGRLAIDRVLGDAPLDQVVGRVHRVRLDGIETTVVPLPHPSGASGWIHAPGHAALLDAAIARIAECVAGLADEAPAAARRRSVA